MKSVTFIVALVLSAGTAALAQDQGAMQGSGGDRHAAFMQACGQDMQTYCASAQNRDDRRSCARANMDKFSDSCKSFMASHFHHHGEGGEGSQGGGQ